MLFASQLAHHHVTIPRMLHAQVEADQEALASASFLHDSLDSDLHTAQGKLREAEAEVTKLRSDMAHAAGAHALMRVRLFALGACIATRQCRQKAFLSSVAAVDNHPASTSALQSDRSIGIATNPS